MKLKLSERAERELVALHESAGEQVSLTHFLNTLISKEYAAMQAINNIPPIEDCNNGSTKQSMPTLQH
ncbi:hypothetical protein [Marinobacter sp.]|uniref:hypothetical protein n=1 Tax=Marinobacter sp. TaxID=50741 RepID=UPI003A8F5B40